MAEVAASIVLVIVFVFTCLYFMTRKKRSGLIEHITDPVTGRKRLRIFDGHFERGKHDNLYRFGEAQLCNVVFIESSIPLEQSHLITALVALANKHPYLRMKCEWGQDGKRYLTEMDRFTENELLYSNETEACAASDWVSRYEEEFNEGHDLARGPLWRVIKIQESFDSTTNKYKSVFLFSFNHTICGEMSVLTFLDQLLEILNQLHWNRFDSENTASLPILPPLLDLIKQHTYLNWLERIAMSLKTKLQSFKCVQNNFLELFPPPLLKNPAMIRKTCIIPGSLSEKETTLLVQNCKANNCTVTGALAVSLAIALFEMTEKFGKNLQDMTVGFPVNVRKGCRPVVSDKDFGVFIGIIFLKIPKCEGNFWDQAQKITCELKQQLLDSKQYGIVTSMENELFSTAQFYDDSQRNTKNAGRYPNFELTNCGNFTFDKNRVHTVKKLHFAVSQNVIGPSITLSSVTVNSQLNWTVIYSNAAIHNEHASCFSKLFNETLIKLGCY